MRTGVTEYGSFMREIIGFFTQQKDRHYLPSFGCRFSFHAMFAYELLVGVFAFFFGSEQMPNSSGTRGQEADCINTGFDGSHMVTT